MEHINPHQGGEHSHAQFHEQPLPPEQERLTDDRLIYHGITEALREDRPIDHATARAIASQLHGGQKSPLYALAASGALVDGLPAELERWRTEAPVELEPWLDALDEYIEQREDAGPIEGWHALWPAAPSREADEPASPGEERPPYGTSACAMGRTAVSVSVQLSHGEDEPAQADVVDEDEEDHFPWTDAATWSLSAIARESVEDARYSSDELDALFDLVDEQVGSVDELGWYGRVKHEGRPGGLILHQDEQGFRHVREALDDEALDAEWSAIQKEYETFYEQRDAYEQTTAEPEPSPSGLYPRIWVGSEADYTNGRLYGVWMNAALEPEELEAATQFMLRHSAIPGAEEWAIMDYDGFGGYKVDEWTSFETVSLIAQGVAEHGEAYAAWVKYVGDTSGRLLEADAFHGDYQGEFESVQDYVKHFLEETGIQQELDRALEVIPESVRRYVRVDVEMMARDWEIEGLWAVESAEGGVHVFSTNV
jgi:antirestriction protein